MYSAYKLNNIEGAIKISGMPGKGRATDGRIQEFLKEWMEQSPLHNHPLLPLTNIHHEVNEK